LGAADYAERRDLPDWSRVRADLLASLRGTAVVSDNALVLVPTYNERANLPVLIAGLMEHPGVRVMVIDDQSPDGTGELADRLAERYAGRIEVLHRTGRRGLGRAYIDGMMKAVGETVEVVCQMDADLSHDPRQLPQLLAAAASADVVI